MVVKEYRLVGKPTKSIVQAGKSMEKGKNIKVTFYERVDGEKGAKPVKRKMKVVAFYTHHVVLENEFGIRQSFRYWDLEKMIKGERTI